MHEEQRERLRVLADSINDTARMARATNSLFLFVALYLALTLLSTTDESLLRNGQVVLPQVGAGISVVQSYVLAPVVFLYLHGQALVLLIVLARKVRTFEAVLREEIPGAGDNSLAKRKECKDWLSAFALVQVFQGDSGLSTMSRVLTWLATEAIPLTLLIAIDLSFVRYQSDEITWIHHVVFVADLWLVVWFNQQVFGGRPATTWGRLSTWTRTTLALSMMGLLVFFTHPPNGTESSYYIWRHDDQPSTNRFFLHNLVGGGNLLDAGPCRWWGMACRYLDLSHLDSRARAASEERDPVSGQFGDHDREQSRRGSVAELHLSKRKLRFARFRHAQLQGANFEFAQLQGADFEFAQLQNADLAWAGLQRARLTEARLQGADLYEAQLQGASLNAARLQEAHLRNAELQGADLQGAHLQAAILRGAQLVSANLKRAQLQGAVLWNAELSGSNLTRALLQGAELNDASLRGANLSHARLEAVDFVGTRLGGANLRKVRLLCSSGVPADWRQAWMPDLTYKVYKLGDSKTDWESDEAAENLLDLLITDDIGTIRMPYEDDRSLEDHLRYRLKNCPRRPFSGSGPEENDLVLHSGKPPYAFANWPASAATNDAYWKAWGEWTVKFACESEYNARSSMSRWRDIESRFGTGISDTAVDIVRKSLIDARSSAGGCPGLSGIPDDDRGWISFVSQK